MNPFKTICFGCLCLAIATPGFAQEPTTREAAMPSIELRDPTVPSEQILERLESQESDGANALAPVASPSEKPLEVTVAPLPKLVLKAIVMLNASQGVALLEAADRKINVRLSRSSLATSSGGMSEEARLNGFMIDGMTFHVVNYSDRSLLLRSDDRLLLVQ